MRKYLLAVMVILGCTEARVKKYEALLNPMLGNAKKSDVSLKLGKPASCQPIHQMEKCEYRTAAARNDFVPAVHRREPGYESPDVSPFDTHDVLYIYFDAVGVFKDWEPVSVPQQ